MGQHQINSHDHQADQQAEEQLADGKYQRIAPHAHCHVRQQQYRGCYARHIAPYYHSLNDMHQQVGGKSQKHCCPHVEAARCLYQYLAHACR